MKYQVYTIFDCGSPTFRDKHHLHQYTLLHCYHRAITAVAASTADNGSAAVATFCATSASSTSCGCSSSAFTAASTISSSSCSSNSSSSCQALACSCANSFVSIVYSLAPRSAHLRWHCSLLLRLHHAVLAAQHSSYISQLQITTSSSSLYTAHLTTAAITATAITCSSSSSSSSCSRQQQL
jgi:hypothetical protein